MPKLVEGPYQGTVVRLLRSREVCNLLGIHIKTLQKWCREGLIPFIRIRGQHYFRESALETFLANREVRVKPLKTARPRSHVGVAA